MMLVGSMIMCSLFSFTVEYSKTCHPPELTPRPPVINVLNPNLHLYAGDSVIYSRASFVSHPFTYLQSAVNMVQS